MTSTIDRSYTIPIPNSLLKTATTLSTTLQNVTDYAGNSSPLKLATNRVAIGSGSITGTGLLNFPDAGTTASDGIAWGSQGIYRISAGFLCINSGLSVVGTAVFNGNHTLSATGYSLAPPTLIGSSATSALSLTQTLNTTGSPDIISMDVTNTASGGSTNLMNLKVGGSTKFKVDKNGLIVTLGGIQCYSTVELYSSGQALSSVGSIRIGSGGANATSAILDVVSTTKGFLPPRMTATQGSAIASPAEGLMIYVTDTNGTFTTKGWWGYNGATWEKLNN